MSDIPTPEAYPASMMVALGVLIDGVRKQLKVTPEITGAQMLSVLEKTGKILEMLTDMTVLVPEGGSDDKKS